MNQTGRGQHPQERFVIVSRHTAAVDFVRWMAEAGEIPFQFGHSAVAVLTGNVTAEDVRGMVVAGNLPLALCAEAREVWAVEFDGAPPRGAEYGRRDMVEAGAKMSCYHVAASPKAWGHCETPGCCCQVPPYSPGLCTECRESRV